MTPPRQAGAIDMERVASCLDSDLSHDDTEVSSLQSLCRRHDCAELSGTPYVHMSETKILSARPFRLIVDGCLPFEVSYAEKHDLRSTLWRAFVRMAGGCGICRMTSEEQMQGMHPCR